MDQPPGRFPPTLGPAWPAPTPTPPGSWSLFPLSVDRILQLTFSMFRFGWRTFIGISLIVTVPATMLVATAQAAVGDELARAQQAQLDIAFGELPDFGEVFPLRAVLVSYLSIIVLGVVGYIVTAAVVHAAAVTAAGGRASIGGSLRVAARLFWRLVGIALAIFFTIIAVIVIGVLIAAAVGIAFGGGFEPGPAVFGILIVAVATVATVLFVLVRWAFAVQAATLEGASASDSLGRSWRLVSGSGWRVLGYTLLVALLIGLVLLLVGLPINILIGSGLDVVGGRVVFNPVTYFASTLLVALLSASIAPIPTIALTWLYLDLRWRRGEPLPVPVPGAEAGRYPPDA